MSLRVLGSLLIVLLPGGLAQEARRKPGDPYPKGDTGVLHITPAPGQIPHSLKELCSAASLIIEGVVQSSLPPRETSPRSLETDALISVTTVLKGATTGQTIVVSQRGGFRGDVNISPAQYSLFQPGQQYILFLTEDTRPKIPAPADGLRRYLVTGIWSGLFYFESGRMRVLADEPDPLRKKYQGLTVAQLISEIAAATNL